MKHTTDLARAIIDEAAAKVLDIDPNVLAGWRERLSKEPTINPSSGMASVAADHSARVGKTKAQNR